MNSQVVVSTLSACLGVITWWGTQDTFSPEWIAACNNAENLELSKWLQENPGIVRYEDAYEFGAFSGLVCKQTQLLHELNESNASALSCVLLATIAVPLLMAIFLEGGRKDAGGLLRIPLATWLMAQNFGLSIIFPLVWLPSYCFSRGEKGSIHPYRIYASLPVAIPILVLTVMVFSVDTNTPLWSHSAALLSGPAVCGTSIILNMIPDPEIGTDKETKKQAAASRRLSGVVYGIAGLVSLALWLWMLFLMVIPTYGASSINAVYGELWVNAPKALRSKTLEALVLWASGLLYIGFHSKQSAFEAVGLSVLFGPGAGLCMALAGLAVELPTPVKKDDEDTVLSHLIEFSKEVWANLVTHGGGDDSNRFESNDTKTIKEKKEE